jgi:hypothetical protein
MERVYHLRGAVPPRAERHPIKTDTVPLAWAAICADCDAIRDVRLGACPACASAAALPLARVLGREAA